MIYVTEGSQDSINNEIFNKAFICLNGELRSKIVFCSSRKSVLDALNYAINNIKMKDILVTLPATKNDFGGFSGHTEFFRDKYQNKNLPMVFKGLTYNALLLTDHIPLKEVTKKITVKLIVNKVSKTLEEFPKYFHDISEVVFSGINPHAGEDGILGDDEVKINEAISDLKKIFPLVKFKGPMAGDTIHFEKQTPGKLFVFAHHDQGLGVFKAQNKLFGLNITLGLPFLRVSPDHGTAKELKNKNQANYLGLYWLFENLIKIS